MDRSDYFAGGNPSDQQNQKRQLQICGPRPSPLSVHKDSHKIKKPPKHPAPPHRDQAPPYVAREPVVIYAVSPKVVHTTASDFMNVVQRLTGISSGVFLESGSSSGGGGDVSPAARLAATENASPRGAKEPSVARDETTAMEEAAEFGGYAPGILSPSPAMLQPASAGIFSSMIQQGGMFSPGLPPGLFSPAGLMSPFVMYSPGYASLVASPTFADVFSHIWDP